MPTPRVHDILAEMRRIMAEIERSPVAQPVVQGGYVGVGVERAKRFERMDALARGDRPAVKARG